MRRARPRAPRSGPPSSVAGADRHDGGYDLHTHTIFSDGTTTPEENVAAAVALGLEGLGSPTTTRRPLRAGARAAEGQPIELVLGTEFSAELAGSSVHVLGYWIDPGYGPLTDELDRLRNEREHRARAIVGPLPRPRCRGVLRPGRRARRRRTDRSPHIAQAVVETGAARDLRRSSTPGSPTGGPRTSRSTPSTPVRAVELLVASGGVAVLAHPGLFGARDGLGGIDDAVVEAMAGAGLAGIEADHPDHTDEHRRRYRDLARALRLEVTAGSDYHGDAKANRLGTAVTARAVVERLRSRRRN
jgi:3',5'-nucleoside bisphosphate phosphatase